jgi:hypothetical protein
MRFAKIAGKLAFVALVAILFLPWIAVVVHWVGQFSRVETSTQVSYIATHEVERLLTSDPRLKLHRASIVTEKGERVFTFRPARERIHSETLYADFELADARIVSEAETRRLAALTPSGEQKWRRSEPSFRAPGATYPDWWPDSDSIAILAVGEPMISFCITPYDSSHCYRPYMRSPDGTWKPLGL